MAYDPSETPCTDLNTVRRHIGDVLASSVFTDDELNGLITYFTNSGETDLYKVAGWALRALSADLLRLLILKKETGVSLADLMEHYWTRSVKILG